MNKRYELYLKTTKKPKNWEYVNFISDMVSKYGKSRGLKWRIGGYSIVDHDDFTKFIEEEVNGQK